MATNYKRKVEKYVEDVLRGRRPAGRYERLAVERHLNDLRKGRKFPYEFHPELGLFVCNFFEELEHYKGEKAGTKIILEGWQAFIIYCVYGWIDKKQSCEDSTMPMLLWPGRMARQLWLQV